MNARARPGAVCRGLLAALEASEGRRTRRMRDTTPDALGLSMKRELLERAVKDDPAADRFEAWLLEQAIGAEAAGRGGMHAIAVEIFTEWQLAQTSPEFGTWLARGAPSEDRADVAPGPGAEAGRKASPRTW